MGIGAQIGSIALEWVRRIPVERILFPPPDPAQKLEFLIKSLPEASVPASQAGPAEAVGTEVEASQPQIEVLPVEGTGYSGTSQLSAAGKACIPCGNDHFSTVSGGLAEAIRFARENGIQHPEVIDRISAAETELNTFERWDGSPEKVARLPLDEKPLMDDMMATSRRLRHQIGDITDVEKLEQTAAEAQAIRRDFKAKTFRMQLGKEMQQRAVKE